MCWITGLLTHRDCLQHCTRAADSTRPVWHFEPVDTCAELRLGTCDVEHSQGLLDNQCYRLGCLVLILSGWGPFVWLGGLLRVRCWQGCLTQALVTALERLLASVKDSHLVCYGGGSMVLRVFPVGLYATQRTGGPWRVIFCDCFSPCAGMPTLCCMMSTVTQSKQLWRL
jgi:hypothetical protein